MSDWTAVAHRGEFRTEVLSPALSARDHVPMHRDATIATVVHPDDGEPFALGFVSAAALRAFILEMRPHEIEYCVIDEADGRALDAMVSADAGDSVH